MMNHLKVMKEEKVLKNQTLVDITSIDIPHPSMDNILADRNISTDNPSAPILNFLRRIIN